jgi:predicted acylesterase/phospholipase RssA
MKEVNSQIFRDWVLMCQGGGGKGAWEAGFIYELCANNVFDFKTLIGTSVGALNCALYLQCIADGSFDRFRKIWLDIDKYDILDTNIICGIFRFIGRGAFSSNNKLSRIIDNNINLVDVDNVINQKAKYLYIYTTQYETWDWCIYPFCFRAPFNSMTSRDDVSLLRTALLASSSIPLLFPPIMHQNMKLHDGGLCANNPMGSGNVNLGLQNVLILSPIDREILYHPNRFAPLEIQLIYRMLSVQYYVNSLIRKPNIYFVIPSKELTTSTIKKFTRKNTRDTFELGQEDARRFLNNMNSREYDLMSYQLSVPRTNIIRILERIGVRMHM